MADDLGLNKRPHEALIERQLATWTDGPPEGWAEMQQMYEQAVMLQQQAMMVDPMAAQTMQLPPQPFTPFSPRPTDEDPAVAPIRYRKLREFIAGSDYQKHDPMWRGVIDMEYQRMRQAAGVATMAEQQMAMQQQAQMQQEQQAAEQEGKAQEGEKARAFQGEQADQDRAENRSQKTQDRALKLATAPPQQAANA
jgi:hypothetical protein